MRKNIDTDQRKMLPVDIIINEGLEEYEKNKKKYLNLFQYYKSRERFGTGRAFDPHSLKAETLRRFKQFVVMMGMNDDSAMDFLMDCFSVKEGHLSIEYVKTIKATDKILLEVLETLKDIKDKVDSVYYLTGVE